MRICGVLCTFTIKAICFCAILLIGGVVVAYFGDLVKIELIRQKATQKQLAGKINLKGGKGV